MISHQLSPADIHNQTLMENVRPQIWINPRPAERYNLVVIGGGTAGLVAAAGAAGLGAKVALVEKRFLGGDCLNFGCVPSKALIRAARAWRDIQQAGQFGIQVKGAEVHFPEVMERLRKVRAQISPHDSAKRFQSLGVDIFFGHASFRNQETITVDGQHLRFAKAVIATGSSPRIPNIPGLAEAGYHTNETIFSLTELPSRLAVLGGGPIGCELAQAFRRLGSGVVLFHKHPRLLPREDSDVADLLRITLEREGILIRLGCEPHLITASDGKKLIYFRVNGKQECLSFDAILIAAGRAPNVAGLDLNRAEVDHNEHGIITTDFLQTTNRSIYAAGDVCLKWKFTHTADAAARIVIQNALFHGRKRVSKLVVPWVTYTDPEIARVGISEEEASRDNLPIKVYKREFHDVDRAILDDECNGFAKIVTSSENDRILGAAIIGRHAGEMINELTLAMSKKIGLGALANIIHPYPTQAEVIRQVADAFNRTRLTPIISSLLHRWMEWNR